MPLKLVPPRTGKTPNYSIRGHTSGSLWTEAQELLRKPLQNDNSKARRHRIERGEYPEKPKQRRLQPS
jgi:hypothetical protein